MVLTTRKTESKFIDEIPVFADVEPEFINFTPGCRVLPAPYYSEYNNDYTLKQRYEPGEKPSFKDGGFEVWEGKGGKILSFDLDQIVLHPFELGKMKYFTKSDNIEVKEKITDPDKPKGSRGRPAKLDENGNRIVKEAYVPTGGQRGRKRLSEEEKAKRELEKVNQPIKEKGQRGRKPLSEEERAERELIAKQLFEERQAKIAAGIITGKRGRVSTLTSEQREERRLKEEEKDRLRAAGLLKRGRPSIFK